MAALTVGTAIVPYRSQWKGQGVTIKIFTGTGGDDSTIAAAADGYRHVIVAGRMSCSGTDSVNILSAASVIDTLQFVVASTVTLPAGLEGADNEALIINKVGTSTTCQGWIAYASIVDGQPLAI